MASKGAAVEQRNPEHMTKTPKVRMGYRPFWEAVHPSAVLLSGSAELAVRVIFGKAQKCMERSGGVTDTERHGATREGTRGHGKTRGDTEEHAKRRRRTWRMECSAGGKPSTCFPPGEFGNNYLPAKQSKSIKVTMFCLQQ